MKTNNMYAELFESLSQDIIFEKADIGKKLYPDYLDLKANTFYLMKAYGINYFVALHAYLFTLKSYADHLNLKANTFYLINTYGIDHFTSCHIFYFEEYIKFLDFLDKKFNFEEYIKFLDEKFNR